VIQDSRGQGRDTIPFAFRIMLVKHINQHVVSVHQNRNFAPGF
jgi:hypothetical protein